MAYSVENRQLPRMVPLGRDHPNQVREFPPERGNSSDRTSEVSDQERSTLSFSLADMRTLAIRTQHPPRMHTNQVPDQETLPET